MITKPKLKYPWLELYQLESTPSPRASEIKRRGRPARPIKRTKRGIELTDEEHRILITLQGMFQARVRSASRGQIVGLALRRLEQDLIKVVGQSTTLPEKITDWQSLMTLLDGKGGKL